MRKRMPVTSGKCGKNGKPDRQYIVSTMMEMLNTVKVYHWNTRSYAEHKATDELYGKLNEHIDTFVEVLLGKSEDRLRKLNKHVILFQSHKKDIFRNRIYHYREFLKGMNKCLSAEADTDLLNIRDEILGDLNQFLYLLTFK